MDFKIGDIVVLKSDGPKMTIEKIGSRNSNNAETVIHCVWFDNLQGNEQLKRETFVTETLIKKTN